jgi:hypothetical protein
VWFWAKLAGILVVFKRSCNFGSEEEYGKGGLCQFLALGGKTTGFDDGTKGTNRGWRE